MWGTLTAMWGAITFPVGHDSGHVGHDSVRLRFFAPHPSGIAPHITTESCPTSNGITAPLGPEYSSHEVMLFAGKYVIGIQGPPINAAINPTQSTTPTSPPTEYALGLLDPNAKDLSANPANYIFRLDGDSIILEGSYSDPANPNVTLPGPCINSDSTPPCPPPPPRK